MYNPYSPEWHRKRYLKESLDLYFDNYVEVEVIYEDLMNIINERSEDAYAEFQKAMHLESKLRKK
jgi:intein/homing endonuclease